MANKQVTLKDLCDDIIKEFTINITDRIFLMIEEDRVLLKKYLDQVAVSGNLNHVNSSIGKEIKRRLDLGNLDRDKKPKSKLIESYQEHEPKVKP